MLCAVAWACTSLPELGETTRGSAAEAPRVSTQRGELSERRSEALLERQDKVDEPTLLDRHLANMQRLSDSSLMAGNSARLLVDGPDTYEVIFQAIGSARDHVNVETYILEEDEVGKRLSDSLIEKQSQGVQVNLLYDSVGSMGTRPEFFDRLRASGVNVCAFNPLLPSWGRSARLNQRDHRKQVIVDGRVAISGGINFSNVYSRGSLIGWRKKAPSVTSGWRDTNIEVRGPAVAKFQELFLATWEKQRGPPIAARVYFPELTNQGDKVVQVIGSSSDDELSQTYLALLSAITEARQSIRITVAYFVPNGELLDALTAAARKGVDVKLILPGFSDSWIVFHAGRSYYGELLAAGVEIYELRGALLHAKTAVIDDVWSTVGSTNMDWRSFLHNDELNTIVLGEEFGKTMTTMFEADRRDATRIDLARWETRGAGNKVKEQLAKLLRYWL